MNDSHAALPSFDYPLSDQLISAYRRDGFVSIPDVIISEELRLLRCAVEGAVASESGPPEATADRPPGSRLPYESIFNQKVNLWTRHPSIARVVCRP